MSAGKRKRDREESIDTPRKKVVLESPTHNIKVSVIHEDHHWTPILGMYNQIIVFPFSALISKTFPIC